MAGAAILAGWGGGRLSGEKAAEARGTLSVEALVREHAEMVYRVAHSVLRHGQDAEDAAQETFLRLLKQERRLAEISDPKAWLARVAWRAALDRHAKRGTRDVELDEAALPPAHAGDGAESELDARRRQQQLRELICTLPRELREVIELSLAAELNSAQIGDVLSIPEATVRTRQMRARKLLKEKLSAKERKHV